MVRKHDDHDMVLAVYSAGIVTAEMVGQPDTTFPQIKRQLAAVAKKVQQVQNDWMAAWLHARYADRLPVRRWMTAYCEAQAEGTDSPSCPVTFLVDSGLQSQINQQLGELHPGLPRRTIGLICQKMKGLISGKLSSGKSAFRRGYLILAGLGEYLNFGRPQPIPFPGQEPKNARLIRTGENYFLDVAVERTAEPGERGRNVHYVFTLKTQGRYDKSLQQVLDAILDENSPVTWAGSSLIYKPDRKRWYAAIAYWRPRKANPPLDPQKLAYLVPGVRRPIDLWLQEHGRPEGLRHHGRGVRYQLRKLYLQRLGQQNSYRRSLSSKRSHGRATAIGGWVGKLSRKRADIICSYNRQLARDVIDRLVGAGYGELIYCQPTEGFRETRFLQRAGSVDGKFAGGGWDWHGLGNALKAAGRDCGLLVRVVEADWEFPAETAPKQPGPARDGIPGKNGRKRKPADKRWPRFLSEYYTENEGPQPVTEDEVQTSGV